MWKQNSSRTRKWGAFCSATLWAKQAGCWRTYATTCCTSLNLHRLKKTSRSCTAKWLTPINKRFKIICVVFSFECYDESAGIVKSIRNYEDANWVQPAYVLALGKSKSFQNLVEEYSKSLIAQALNDCKSSKGESRSIWSGFVSNIDFDDGLSLLNTLKSKMAQMKIDGVESLPISKEKLNKYLANKHS